MKEARTSVSFDRKTCEFVGLDDAAIKQLKKAYNGIDVDKELSKMKVWLLSPKGVRRKGTLTFIMTWLARTTPTPLSVPEQLDIASSSTPLGDLLRDYLHELWKDRHHLFQFNTIQH